MDTMTVEKVDGPNASGWYDVFFDDGVKASTKNEEMAKAAFQSRGSEVPVVLTTRVNGKFTNIYLNEIDGVKDTPKRGKGGTGSVSAPAKTAGRTPAENDRIARQWAYGRAVEIMVASDGDFHFPLNSEDLSKLSEVATALIDATKE